MSVLENTFRTALPLLFLSLGDILEGQEEPLHDARKLILLFGNNPYKALWEQKKASYVSMLASLGISLKNPSPDFNGMVEPLLDAFSFYQNLSGRDIWKVRDGGRCGDRPLVASNICKYSSEKEFVDAIAGCGHPCAVVFGAIEKTFAQTTDFFYEWFHGYPEERMRNWMHYDHLTREEFLDSVDKYSRVIYLGVKSGDTIWLVSMPYRTEVSSGTYDDSSARYACGRRAGYAPYEVYFKDTPAAPEGASWISLRAGGWPLNGLMEDDSKIWLPAFLEETYQYFYTSVPESKEILLPEEMAASLPHKEENLPVPEKNSLPSEKSFVYQIPEPKELFPEEYMQKLIDYFVVTPEDIIKAPILPHKAMSGSDAVSVAEKNTKGAYRKILADRITDFLYDNIPAAREKAVDFILNNKEGILEKTIAGCFSDYLEEIVDGTPVIGSDGEPLMVRKNRYSNEKTPSRIHTSRRDGTPRRRQELLDWPQMPAVFWIGESETGDWKPPVLWKLQFQDAAGYALLFGVREEELDDIFRLSGYLRTFWTENERTFFYTLLGRPEEEKRNNQGNIQVPRLADINFCMTKRYRRKLIKERENKSVGEK